tara:strand:+ start:491 stop:721 length:231 start_codon:yes stop_codon:yes gene_type:complete
MRRGGGGMQLDLRRLHIRCLGPHRDWTGDSQRPQLNAGLSVACYDFVGIEQGVPRHQRETHWRRVVFDEELAAGVA